ncbi:MAG: RNA polymerase sigma factor region1.1 domain-containing protein, partial [Burkholderiales bacterium]
MTKDKRKTKRRQARRIKKKSSAVNKLKLRRAGRRASARKPRPAAKRAHKELRRAKKIAAAKPAPQKPEGKKTKATIKSAKHALELLEARVNAGLKKSKGGRTGRKGRKEEWLLAAAAQLPKEDAETRRTRLKNLIKLGKDRGFLTYSEINDHLPDDLVDAEQIEAIISTFGDMGIQVYDQAPDQETLLISAESTTVATVDEDVEEQAEAALSTVDSEFGRTTDPVRMYMRE